MENLSELLKNRRSIRKYTEEPISPENVKELLEAALMAPSSKRSLCWEFVVIEDTQQMEQLSHCKAQGAKPIAGAKLAIVVLADPAKSDVWIEDASIAAILIQLQAEDLGLGSCWIQIRNRLTESGQSAEDYVREMLGIPYEMEILSIITLGHKNEEKKPFDPEKAQWEKVHIGHW